MKLDLHIHTNHSQDSFIRIQDLINYIRRSDLDGIAITDHNTTSALKRIPKIQDIIIIPGIEVRSEKGDILGLGVQENIKQGLSVEETIDLIRAQGGIAVVAHPFAMLIHPHCLRNLIKEIDVDGIEVYNSRNLIGDKPALNIANKRRLGMTAGSDAHLLKEVGNATTVFNQDSKDIDQILKDIKHRRTKIEGQKISFETLSTYFISRLLKSSVNHVKSFNKR